MRSIIKVFRKLILAPFIIYIYNLIAAPLNLVIPINIFTVIFVSFLGIPGLITLIIFLLVAF